MQQKSSHFSPSVVSNESYSGSSKSYEKKNDPFNDDTDYDDDDDDDYDYNAYDSLEPKEVVPESGKRWHLFDPFLQVSLLSSTRDS